jgi:hypothetical protein
VGVPEAPAPVAVVDAELSRLTSAAWTTEAEPTLKPRQTASAGMSHRERGVPTAGVMVGLVEKPSERKLIMASPGAIEGPSLLRQHCDRAASDKPCSHGQTVERDSVGRALTPERAETVARRELRVEVARDRDGGDKKSAYL